MNRYRLSDLSVGMRESFSVTVTEDKAESFFGITGDDNPLHRDEAYAKGQGFPGKVSYGMLTASFLSTLAGVYLPGERSLIQSVETKFLKPVFPGDVLTVEGTVTEIHESVRQIVLKTVITNQDDIKVVKGTMKIGVRDDG